MGMDETLDFYLHEQMNMKKEDALYLSFITQNISLNTFDIPHKPLDYIVNAIDPTSKDDPTEHEIEKKSAWNDTNIELLIWVNEDDNAYIQKKSALSTSSFSSTDEEDSNSSGDDDILAISTNLIIEENHKEPSIFFGHDLDRLFKGYEQDKDIIQPSDSGHFRIEEDQFCLQGDSHFSLHDDSHFSLHDDSHFSLQGDSHFSLHDDSHFSLHDDSHFSLHDDSHFSLHDDSHFSLHDDSHVAMDNNSHFGIKDCSQLPINSNSHTNMNDINECNTLHTDISTQSQVADNRTLSEAAVHKPSMHVLSPLSVRVNKRTLLTHPLKQCNKQESILKNSWIRNIIRELRSKCKPNKMGSTQSLIRTLSTKMEDNTTQNKKFLNKIRFSKKQDESINVVTPFKEAPSRYHINTERALYRLSQVKLSNTRRPLHQQVVITNMLYSYLSIYQQEYPSTYQYSNQGRIFHCNTNTNNNINSNDTSHNKKSYTTSYQPHYSSPPIYAYNSCYNYHYDQRENHCYNAISPIKRKNSKGKMKYRPVHNVDYTGKTS